MIYTIKLYHAVIFLSRTKVKSMKILSYVFGIGAMIAIFVGYQTKTRKGLLISKLFADVSWFSHYLCLGATAGMIPNALGFFRELIYMRRGKNKWASLPLWPVLFIAMNWAIVIPTYSSPFDILPIAGSSLATVLFWIKRPLITKIFLFPVSIAFLIYNIHVGSYIGIANEIIGISSLFIYYTKYFIGWRKSMENKVFRKDHATNKELLVANGAPISDVARTVSYASDQKALDAGQRFSDEIRERFVADFEKEGDKMAHVSTFLVVGNYIYMTYYANTKEPSEDPKNQTARIAYAPLDDPSAKVCLDVQTTQDRVGGRVVDMVYDTILMQKDEKTLYIMWTARIEDEAGGNYYRFWRPFDIPSATLGEVGVNRFKVGDTVNDFSVSGIRSALAENGIPVKKMYSDIGIMQKLSSRLEGGVRYYYSGTYSGDFNCVIKSRDLITWEYVSQPDFINDSKWENATYVLGDKCFYFVRQQDSNKCGFLTAYDTRSGKWERSVEIEDCQSRGDFIEYGGSLYLFHAPIDREHIGVVRINTDDISKSEPVLLAKMPTSCFYPFVNYFPDGELALSYTVARKHIRLARFTLSAYI